LEVLAAPAGAGKSFALSALTQVWQADGGQVLGVATSRKAMGVLREEGIDNVETITSLLTAAESAAAGGPIEERLRLRPGQLLIVDEAGMSATADLDRLRGLVEQAGGKMLMAGDHRQLSPVEAGGVFAELAERGGGRVHTFAEVRRFRDVDPVTGERRIRHWEAQASLGLRQGRVEALDAYADHGRLRSGAASAMVERAYQGWLADHLAGHDSLLIARTGEQAAELATRARADLVRAGRVEADGVGLHNNTRAGVGDLVQLRLNAAWLKTDSGRRWAVNRDVVQVLERETDGSLVVAYADGDQLRLPAGYVREHVELAYATTVHGAQGRTVVTCHSLIDALASRELAYVALTRGWQANYAYVITHDQQPGTRPVPVEEIPDMRAVLADVLERSEIEHSAHEVLRRELEAAGRLDALTPIWTDLAEQEAAARYGQALATALGPDGYRRLKSAEGYGPLLRLARHAEAQGLDAVSMLGQAVGVRELDTAKDPARALHWRLEQELGRIEAAEQRAEQWSVKNAGVEGEAAMRAELADQRRLKAQVRTSWVVRTPEGEGELDRVRQELAELMDARRAELGWQQAEAPAPWALERLGPVPEDAAGRAAWAERAGWVAAYREAYRYEHERDAIGPCPPRGAVDARLAWEAAWLQLGEDAERDRIAAATDTQLRNVITAWEREQAWAPPYAAEELQAAYLAAGDYRAQAVQTRLAPAQQPEEREQVRAEATELAARWDAQAVGQRAAALERLAVQLEERAAALEQVHRVRQAWCEETAAVRQRAEQAQLELERRAPIEPEPQAPAAMAQRVPPAMRGEEPRAETEPARLDVATALEQAQRAEQILTARAQARVAAEAEAQHSQDAWVAERQAALEAVPGAEVAHGPQLRMPGPGPM